MNSNPTVLSSWFEHGYPYSYGQTVLSTVLKLLSLLTAVFRYDVHCKKSKRLFFIVSSKWYGSIVAMTESRWLKAFCVIHFNTTHKPLSRNNTLTHKHTCTKSLHKLNTDQNHLKSTICNSHFRLKKWVKIFRCTAKTEFFVLIVFQ